MKKLVLFSITVLLLSSMSIGCSSTGSTSWCRSGSLFPTARNKQANETVYMTSVSARNCDPCTPNQCQPCEPATCNPCEPVCNPCDNTAVRATVVPGPIAN